MRANDIKVIYCKTSFGKKFFDYLDPNYYNSMPLHHIKNWYNTQMRILELRALNNNLTHGYFH